MTNPPVRDIILNWDNVETKAGDPVIVEAKLHIGKHSMCDARVWLRVGNIGNWERQSPGAAYSHLQVVFDKAAYELISTAIARSLDHLARCAVADFTAAAGRYFLPEGK